MLFSQCLPEYRAYVFTELAEATYLLYRATRDPFYLRVGAEMVCNPTNSSWIYLKDTILLLKGYLFFLTCCCC